jgi:hypothetical protein
MNAVATGDGLLVEELVHTFHYSLVVPTPKVDKFGTTPKQEGAIFVQFRAPDPSASEEDALAWESKARLATQRGMALVAAVVGVPYVLGDEGILQVSIEDKFPGSVVVDSTPTAAPAGRYQPSAAPAPRAAGGGSDEKIPLGNGFAYFCNTKYNAWYVTDGTTNVGIARSKAMGNPFDQNSITPELAAELHAWGVANPPAKR